jgi:hypothetical protein
LWTKSGITVLNQSVMYENAVFCPELPFRVAGAVSERGVFRPEPGASVNAARLQRIYLL